MERIVFFPVKIDNVEVKFLFIDGAHFIPEIYDVGVIKLPISHTKVMYNIVEFVNFFINLE